jgi:hypothetical protein
MSEFIAAADAVIALDKALSQTRRKLSDMDRLILAVHTVAGVQGWRKGSAKRNSLWTALRSRQEAIKLERLSKTKKSKKKKT